MLFKPLYIRVWDLDRPGGSRQDRVVVIGGQGDTLAAELKGRGLGQSSACLQEKTGGLSGEAVQVTCRNLQLL